MCKEAELDTLNERFAKLQQDFEGQLSSSQQLEMEVSCSCNSWPPAIDGDRDKLSL